MLAIEPRMFNRAVAGRFCGLTTRRFAAAVRDNTLPPPVTVAGADVWHVEQLKEALDRIAGWSPDKVPASRAAQRVQDAMRR